MSVAVSRLVVPAWLVWVSRLVVAGVFVAAAVPKLMDPVTFAEDVANYDSFPEFSRHIIAAFIPVLELVAAASGADHPRAVALRESLEADRAGRARG